MEFQYTNHFHCQTVEQARDYLNKYGVAVLLDVLDPFSCQEFEDGIWRVLNTVSQEYESPINKQDPVSYHNLTYLSPYHKTLVRSCGIPHAQEVWDIRQDSRVVKAFADMYGEGYDRNFMLSNVNGMLISMPPEATGSNYLCNNDLKLRINQHWKKSIKRNIEGQVNITNIEAGDSTFLCIPGSNRYFNEFFKVFLTKSNIRQFDLKDGHVDWFINECNLRPVAMTAPKGSITFYDSRTACCDIAPVIGRPNPGNIRMSLQVSMSPKNYHSDRNIDKIKKGFEQSKITENIPHYCCYFSEVQMRNFTADLLTEIKDKPKLTKLGRKIMGF